MDLACVGNSLRSLGGAHVRDRGPGDITGFDWLWIGIGLFADFVSYGGGAGRKQLPGYQGY